VLYDQYDKLALGYWSGVKDDYTRLFEFIHPSGTIPGEMFLPRFSQVAFLVQMLHLDLEKEVERLKGGSLSEADKKELTERAEYAKKWLSEYALEKFVFKLQDELPEAARSLNAVQKNALKLLVAFIEATPTMPSGEDLHHKLHALKDEVPIAPAELFSSIYFAFLGKSFGPKAGWFLSVLPHEFVLKRLKEASQ
jgi:lysyl-tRNA synthetase class 1